MKELTGIPSIDKPWLKWYNEEELAYGIPRMKIYDFLKIRNSSNLSDTAISYFGTKITYKELIDNIDRIALSYLKLGVKQGEIVTFCCPTLPEVIYSIYALNKIGAVPALIDPTTNNDRILEFIKLFESKNLVMVDLAYNKLKEVVEKTDLENVIITSPKDSLSKVMNFGYDLKNILNNQKVNVPIDKNIDNISYFDKPRYLNYSSLRELREEKPNYALFTHNSPAAIVLTSGTTGNAKGAVLSNENLNYLAVANECCTNMRNNDKFLNIMPPFIAYGLVCGINNVLTSGMEMVIVPKIEKRDQNDIKREKEIGNYTKLDKSSMLDSLILKHNPQFVLGVPNFFVKLNDSNKMKHKNLSYVKGFIAGGDTFHPAKEELVNNFLEAHECEYKINKGYGMTELSSAATYTKPNSLNKLGSVGIPLMYNNVKILSPSTGEELGYNEIGELYMSGPGVILGYFGNEEETKKTFIKDENGVRWVKTGDLFSIDEDGVLFFHGRIKRMMIRPDGHNVFNEPIEDIILKNEKVSNCAVVGVKDDKLNGEIPTAFVVLKEEFENYSDIIEKELRRECLAKLPERDVALNYVFVKEIPYTTVGKVNFRALEEEGKKILTKKK